MDPLQRNINRNINSDSVENASHPEKQTKEGTFRGAEGNRDVESSSSDNALKEVKKEQIDQSSEVKRTIESPIAPYQKKRISLSTITLR